ncbi:replicative DNA helicase [Weeksellaceae bacterium TAE3-ERU29]|nr:replicative DNA helicase [Weeksellaceae bacterium TAE3-ERU29]
MEQARNFNTSKKSKSITSEIGRGKMPPQAVDLEEAVLGAMMIDKKGLNETIEILEEDFFYRPQHKDIFAAISTLFNDSQPIDLLTVSNQLKKDGKFDSVGGDLYLIGLTEKVSSSAHIEYHARVIQEKYVLRKLIEISSNIIDKAYNETTDIFDLLDESESEIFKITDGSLKSEYQDSKSLVYQAIEEIKAMSKKEGLSGIPSGFKDIDKITSGFHPSDLVILAARPGMGKTAFVLSMAKNVAVDYEIPVAVFSLEMSSVQLIKRLIVGETGIDNDKIKKGKLNDAEWKQLYTKVKSLENAPLFIDDTPALNIFDLRAKCRRLVSQHGVKMIVIDYLQLMTSKDKSTGTREQEISAISRGLKAIAKELEVPVIALSQLSRSVETRGGSKRPLLSDLRESGAIEQDADIVSFIYRPEYYKLDTWDDEEHTPCEGQAEFIIAKHRNGALENIRLKFIAHQAKFADLNPDTFFLDGPVELQSSMNSDLASSGSELPTINPEDSFGVMESKGFDDSYSDNYDGDEPPF